MCVSTRAIYNCKVHNNDRHSTLRIKAADVCSRGPCFNTHDTNGSIHEERPCRQCNSQTDGQQGHGLRLDTVGTKAESRDTKAVITASGTKQPTTDPASKLRASLLDSLQQRGYLQGRGTLHNKGDGLIDRSSLSFATALEHLESRMGKFQH